MSALTMTTLRPESPLARVRAESETCTQSRLLLSKHTRRTSISFRSTPSGLPTYNEDHGFESGPEEDAPEEPSGESEPEPEPQVTKRSSRSSSSRSGGKLKIKLSAPPNGSSTKVRLLKAGFKHGTHLQLQKSAPRVQETFEDPFGTASSGAAGKGYRFLQ